jgi:hypothetical protein
MHAALLRRTRKNTVDSGCCGIQHCFDPQLTHPWLHPIECCNVTIDVAIVAQGDDAARLVAQESLHTLRFEVNHLLMRPVHTEVEHTYTHTPANEPAMRAYYHLRHHTTNVKLCLTGRRTRRRYCSSTEWLLGGASRVQHSASGYGRRDAPPCVPPHTLARSDGVAQQTRMACTT